MRHQGNQALQSTVSYQILFLRGRDSHRSCIVHVFGNVLLSEVWYSHMLCILGTSFYFFFFWLSTPHKGTWNLVSSLLVNSVQRILCILDSDVFTYYSLAWYRYSGCTNVRGRTFKRFNQGQGTEIKYFVENRMSFVVKFWTSGTKNQSFWFS